MEDMNILAFFLSYPSLPIDAPEDVSEEAIKKGDEFHAELILIDSAETPQHDIRLMMAKQFPDMESVGSMLHGKRILITGSAGSIGSEMVRYVARRRKPQRAEPVSIDGAIGQMRKPDFSLGSGKR